MIWTPEYDKYQAVDLGTREQGILLPGIGMFIPALFLCIHY